MLSQSQFPRTWEFLYGEYLNDLRNFFLGKTRVRTGLLRDSLTIRVSGRGFIIFDAQFYYRYVTLNDDSMWMKQAMIDARKLVLFDDTLDKLEKLIVEDFEALFGPNLYDNDSLLIAADFIRADLIPRMDYINSLTPDSDSTTE